ncbi:beta strand repeat-containing protein [Enterovibrio sp. 27052020O]|uniref:beta strand repeat-containing protein n=1 Tax=Enterovibrio sp. 27052020O TaxID=3241166 RepID=UPI00388E3A90
MTISPKDHDSFFNNKLTIQEYSLTSPSDVSQDQGIKEESPSPKSRFQVNTPTAMHQGYAPSSFSFLLTSTWFGQALESEYPNLFSGGIGGDGGTTRNFLLFPDDNGGQSSPPSAFESVVPIDLLILENIDDENLILEIPDTEWEQSAEESHSPSQDQTTPKNTEDEPEHEPPPVAANHRRHDYSQEKSHLDNQDLPQPRPLDEAVSGSNSVTVISVSEAATTEGNGGESFCKFNVTLSSVATEATTFSFNLKSLSATLGVDFSGLLSATNGVSIGGGQLVVPAGISSFIVMVPIEEDSEFENVETFNLTVGGKSAIGTIEDNDPYPEISEIFVITEDVLESESVIFNVKLSQASSLETSFNFDFIEGTAAKGVDFSSDVLFSDGVSFDSVTQKIVVSPNVDQFSIKVKTLQDTVDEPNESIIVNVGGKQASANIIDDDATPEVEEIQDAISAFGSTIFESQSAIFTISLTNSASEATQYQLSISDLTATALEDYSSNWSFTQGVTFDPETGQLSVPAFVENFQLFVPTISDQTDEPDEVFRMDIDDESATATIVDDDPTPTISSVSNGLNQFGQQINEGDTAQFTVALTNPSSTQLSFSLNLSDITTVSSDDYSTLLTLSNGVTYDDILNLVYVPAGITSFTAILSTLQDPYGELDESFSLSVGGQSGTATIVDDDSLSPVISVSNAVDSGGNSVDEAETAIFNVSLSNPLGSSAEYSVSLTNGTALVSSDYSNAMVFSANVSYDSGTGKVTVPSGETAFTVSVPTVTDTTDENNETFTLRVGGDAGTATIIDDDPAPTVTAVSNAVDSGGAAVDEAEGAIFTVTLSNPSAFSVDFALVLANGTATLTDDYTNAMVFSDGVTYSSGTGLVSVPAGITSFTVTVPTVSDAIDEADETFTLNVGGQTGTATIIDDDPAPTVTAVSNAVDSGGAAVDEAEGAIFTVTLSNPSAFSVDFALVLANGTATLTDDYTNAMVFSDGVTYSSGTGLVSVPAGITSFTVTVPTVSDAIDEADETFTLNVGGQTGTATIIDDDPAPTVTAVSNAVDSGGAAVDEAEGAIFTVTLSNPSAFSVDFALVLANGTATLTDDYTNAMVFSDGVTYSSGTGLVSVPAGITSFTVTVPTVTDTTDENNETFTLNVGGQTGTATIIDDDPVPTVTAVSNAVDSGGAAVDEAEGAIFTVTLSNPSAFSVDFALVLANGTATLTDDYTNAMVFSDGVTYSSGTGLVSVPAGVTSFTVTVPTVSDAIDEADETFTLNVGGQTGTATIIDDDPAPTVTAVSNAVDSGGAAVDEAEGAIFTVTLSNPSAFSVDFALVLANGTATLTDDYTNAMVFSDGVTYSSGTGLVSVPAGVTSFTVTVPTVSDAIDEADETFTLNVGGQTGTAAILDDDITTPTVTITDDANDDAVILAVEGAATSTNVEVAINHDKFVAGGSVVIDVTNDTNVSSVELVYVGGSLEYAGGGAATGYSYNGGTGVISWSEPATPDNKALSVSAYQIDLRGNTSGTDSDSATMDDVPTAVGGNLMETADSALISFAFSDNISDAVDDSSLVDAKETNVTVSTLPVRDTLAYVDTDGQFQFVEAGDTFAPDTEMRVLQSHQNFGETSIYTDVSMAGTNSVNVGDITVRAVTYTGNSPDQSSVLSDQLLSYGNSSPFYAFDGLGVDSGSGSGTVEIDSLDKESLVIDFGTKTMRDVQIDLQSVLYAPTGSAGAITHAIVLNNNVELADYSYTDIMNNTDGRAIISIEELGGFDEIRLYVVSVDPLVNRNFTLSAVRATEYTSPQSIDFAATDSSAQTSTTETLSIDYNSEGLSATGNLENDVFRVTNGENATNQDQLVVSIASDYWGKITASDGTADYTDAGISYTTTSSQSVHGYDGYDIIETGAGDDLIFTGGTGGGSLGTDASLEMTRQDIRDSLFANRPIGNNAGSLTDIDGLLNSSVISGLTVDIANGGSGNDVIHGGDGTDFLYGHTDDDWLYGHDDNDLLRGGEGNDFIFGGLGDDVLYGDSGNDIFYWQQEDIDASITQNDEITGFVEGEDLIDLSDLLSSGSNTLDLLWITENVNGSSLIYIDTDQDGAYDQEIVVRFFDLDNWSSGGSFKLGIFTPETEALLFTGSETVTITPTQITIDVPDTIVI